MTAGIVLLLAATAAQADYTMWLESGGRDQARIRPGETVQVEVWLASSASDVHDAAIWRVAMSEPGLEYVEYAWASPYQAGSIFDDSKPFIDSLPVTLDEHTLEGGGYEGGVVDVELSNLTMSGAFEQGWLATLSLRVPDTYSGADTITLRAYPESFSYGFDEVPTEAVGDFTILVPSPPGLCVLVLSFARRRR
jgi:hypothetical protein